MTHTGGHFVEKCQSCNRVIAQCRCIEPLKEIRWSVCPDCAGLSGQMNVKVDHATYPEHPGKIVTAGELTRADMAEKDRRITDLTWESRALDTTVQNMEARIAELEAENERLQQIINTVTSWPEMESYRQAISGLLETTP